MFSFVFVTKSYKVTKKTAHGKGNAKVFHFYSLNQKPLQAGGSPGEAIYLKKWTFFSHL